MQAAQCKPALLQGMPSELQILSAPHKVIERRRVIAFGAPLLARTMLLVVLANGISLHKSQESDGQDDELDGDHLCNLRERSNACSAHRGQLPLFRLSTDFGSACQPSCLSFALNPLPTWLVGSLQDLFMLQAECNVRSEQETTGRTYCELL